MSFYNLITTGYIYLVTTAHAANPWEKYYDTFGGSGSGKELIITASIRAGNFFLMLVGGAAIISIMWEAIGMQIGAGGDEGKENAKKAIKYALMGLMFALVGEVLLRFLVTFEKGALY